MISLLLAMALQTVQPVPEMTPAKRPIAAPAAPAKPKTLMISEGDESVCRLEQATGSRITTRECHTRDQWAKMEGSAKEYMDKIQHPQGCAPGSTC